MSIKIRVNVLFCGKETLGCASAGVYVLAEVLMIFMLLSMNLLSLFCTSMNGYALSVLTSYVERKEKARKT